MKTSHFAAFAAAALFVALPLFASASVFKADKIVTVPKAESVTSNLYLAGGQVVVTAPAPQDVVAAGANVTVDGTVGGSVLAAGGNVEVLNDVKGSIRAAGGQIAVSGTVGGDVVVGGGTITILPGSTVAGDVLVAGGTVDIEGTVQGQVRVYGGDVTMNGAVEGPVSIMAGKSVTFGKDASFAGAVAYTAPKEATVVPGAHVGENVTFTKADAKAGKVEFGLGAGLLAILGVLLLIKFVATLATAYVFQYGMPRFTEELSLEFVGSFWKSVLIGFIALIAVPAACIVLALTAIGMYLALILGAFYFLAIVVAGILMCIFTGSLLARWIKKEVRVGWLWTLLGTIIVFVIWIVPVLGWIALLLLFLASFGVVINSLKRDGEAKLG